MTEITLGISSCLLGNEVRHDGGHKRNVYVMSTLSEYFIFRAFCPEMSIGLGVPRPTIRLTRSADGIRLTGSDNPELDLTEQNQNLHAHFHDAGNKIEFPGMHYGGGTYRLVASDYIFGGLDPYPDPWFDQVSYQGAFGTYNWASGWTLVSREGILLD